MEEFLKYWEAGARASHPIDGNVLYDKYKSALVDLETSRLKTCKLLVPANNGKVWHPEFDPDQIEQVVALSNEINEKKETLRSITQAITDFVTLVGGPSLQLLEDKFSTARRNLAMYNIKAKNATSLATNQNRHMSPTEIQDLPNVLTANAALAEARLSLEAEMADLLGRLEKARQILEKAR